MTFNFRPAVRENVPLLIGLAGGTGSGKTYTAMELAKGMTPPGQRFCVIDTEAGRAKHYADRFQFDHGDLGPPFRPDRYTEAIMAADAAHYPVIIVDSTSHVWAGEGGVLDWQEDELNRMAGDDWKKREAVKMASWIKPKGAHKVMVQKLLQVRAHLILCFRAEPKIEMQKDANGKWQVIPKPSLVGHEGWLPICEKNLPFELTVSLMFTADAPGVPKPIKVEQQHRPMLRIGDGVPVTADAGRQLAAWARGDAQMGKVEHLAHIEGDGAYITASQAADLETMCRDAGLSVDALKRKIGHGLDAITTAEYPRVLNLVKAQMERARG